MATRIRIGEILLRAGVIDQHQLNAALGEQRKWGRPLGATLVKLGLVEERELVRALASQLSLPVASLEGKRISPEVLELVPAEVAQNRMVLPLFVKQAERRSTLYLAMEDPGDLAVLDDLAFRTGLQVKPVMMSPSELCVGIDRYYRDALMGRAEAQKQPSSPPEANDAVAPEANDDVALDALQEETGPKTAAASFEDAPAVPDANDRFGESGTDELVRHFTGGGEAISDPPTPESTPTPTPTAASTPAPAPEVAASASVEEAPPTAPVQPSFDETSLAAPPPRAQGEANVEPLLHPPVESLASYDAKTRTILHVLTQLLIEKGVMSREEFHSRVSALSGIEHEAD